MAHTIEQGDIDIAKDVAQKASTGIRAANDTYIKLRKPGQSETWYDRIAVASDNVAFRNVIELAASKLPTLARWTYYKSYIDAALGAIDSSKLQGVSFADREQLIIDFSSLNKKDILKRAIVGITGTIARVIVYRPTSRTSVLNEMQLFPGTAVVPWENIVNPESKPKYFEVVSVPIMEGKYKKGLLKVKEAGKGKEISYDALPNEAKGFVIAEDAKRVLSESQFRAVMCLPLFVKAMQDNLPEYRKRD